MLKISRFWGAAALTALLFSTSSPSHAQTSSLESALDNLPIEKIAGQMLGSIDFSKLIDVASKQAEKAAADVAAGRTPSSSELENSPAMKEMQTQMQQQMAKAMPELLKSFAPLLSGLLQELKQELASGLR